MPSPVKIEEMFYLRVRVPADVQKKVRGSQLKVPIGDSLKTVVISNAVKVSLQTKEALEARPWFVSALAFVEAHWDAVRKGPQSLTHKASLAIAGEIRQPWIGILDDDPGTPEIWQRVIGADKQAAEGVSHPLAAPYSPNQEGCPRGPLRRHHKRLFER